MNEEYRAGAENGPPGTAAPTVDLCSRSDWWYEGFKPLGLPQIANEVAAAVAAAAASDTAQPWGVLPLGEGDAGETGSGETEFEVTHPIGVTPPFPPLSRLSIGSVLWLQSAESPISCKL